MALASADGRVPVRWLFWTMAFAAVVAAFALLVAEGGRMAVLFAIGLAMGVTLYHGAFGFTGAYRRAISEKDISGVAAQLIMIAAAILLFAPVLAAGSALGRGVAASVAPVSVSMAFGAFLFGIGMQLGGSCASGTLYTSGGGNPRMILMLAFFCVGAFWGSLDLGWWQGLPGIGAVSLAETLGWTGAVATQLVALGLIYLALRLLGGRHKRSLWWDGSVSWRDLLRGPWPLLLSAGLLALLNWITLLTAGHAWSITWAFSLWGAKAAVLLGWDPATSAFWSGAFQQVALARPIWSDTVSVMNIGIIGGAVMASALSGRFATHAPSTPLSVLAVVLGGLMMGYGARLAYGCNIGAFFSGVASTSLHGWLWILCAVPGNYVGIGLRGLLRLDQGQQAASPA